MPRQSKYVMTDEQLAGISETDWARLAAFIDGEGSLKVHRAFNYSRTLQRSIKIGNTDLRLMAWLKETFGGYVYHYEAKSDRFMPFSEWIAPAGLADQLLTNCVKYSIIKREQIEIFLALARLIDHKGGWISREKAATRDALYAQLRTQKASQSKLAARALAQSQHVN